MKVALFIGEHTKDNPTVRLGWWLTRMVQKGEFSRVTHVEAILAEHEDGSVTIGSASLREGGVRFKRCHLTPEHWIIVDVPRWDAAKAAQWFAEHDGEKYDWRGAFASCMPFAWGRKNEWFCNGAVGESVGLNSSEIFGPSQFASICESIK
jgi:hypothetical protein